MLIIRSKPATKPREIHLIFNLVALENMDLHPRDNYTKVSLGWQHESIMLCMCVLFLRPPTFIFGFKEDGELEMNSAWSNISMTVRAMQRSKLKTLPCTCMSILYN